MKISISVLVIDNRESKVSQLISKLTALCQWETLIRRCKSGDEATEIILKYQPDVVYINANLNVENCMDVIARINKMESDAAVVFIMDVYDYYLASEAIIGGATDYLVRSNLSIENLNQSLNFIVERKKIKNSFYLPSISSTSITKSLSGATIQLKADGTIVSWSKGAEEAFGYNRNEIIGNSILCIIPERLKSDYVNRFKNMTNSENTKIVETFKLNTLRKDGSEIACGFSISSWRNNKQVYYTAIVTERIND